MRIGTIASLAASAALGLGALAVARIWLPSQTAKAAGPAGQGVPVVIAKGPIAYGAKVQATDLILTRLPADAAPPGAYTSIDQVMKADSGGAPVALAAMAPHEAILPAKLSGPGAKPTLAAMIGQGMRAYTIAVTEVAGGGGHILPGDRVDVLLTRDVSNGTAPGGKNDLQTDIVMQDLKVLGMDLNVDPSSTKPAVAHTATLEVDAGDAERLALAAQAGTLSLALRRVGAAGAEQVRPMATTDLGPAVGLPPVLHAVSGPRVHHKAGPAVAAPAGAAVLVVQGDKEASVKVPAERLGAGV
jgi:pilus assembly protein CpaB